MEIRSSVSSYSLLQSHRNEFDHRARALFEAEGLAPSQVRVPSALSGTFWQTSRLSIHASSAVRLSM